MHPRRICSQGKQFSASTRVEGRTPDPNMAGIVVRELTPDFLDEWLRLFDHGALADNPGSSGCYCYFYHAYHAAQDWDARPAAESREAACGLSFTGRLKGYLAFDERRPVGWVHAAPCLLIPNLQLDASLAIDDADRVGSVICFVIAAPYRHRGVAGALLGAACDSFHAQGLAVAEAYPRTAAHGDGSNYHGPMRFIRLRVSRHSGSAMDE